MKEIKFLTQNFGKYDPLSLDSYLAIGGFSALKKVMERPAEETIDLVKSAKIKGRGGAEYDMGVKLAQARDVKGEGKLVICNADEGETTTFKDRELIVQDPFNLIEGLIISGYLVGATDGYIYMRGEYKSYRPILQNAIKQATEKGYLGESILGKGYGFNLHLYSGAGAYVCGEGTALIRSIEGKAGRPRMKPPYIKQSGAFARPTCLSNVETLSILPHLILDDEKIYMSQGTENSVGTKMISVAGNVNRPGAFEIPFGVTVREIIDELAGGVTDGHKLCLIQFGGASGKVADASILDKPYTYEDLRANGVMVGSGALLVIDERTSLAEFLLMNQDFFCEESCGQCTPCREGNRHIRRLLGKLVDGSATKEDIAQMKELGTVMSKTSLCGLGETAQNTLLSAMKAFPQAFEV